MNEHELDLVFDHALKLKLSTCSEDAALGEVLERMVRPYFRSLGARPGQTEAIKEMFQKSDCTYVMKEA